MTTTGINSHLKYAKLHLKNGKRTTAAWPTVTLPANSQSQSIVLGLNINIFQTRKCLIISSTLTLAFACNLPAVERNTVTPIPAQ